MASLSGWRAALAGAGRLVLNQSYVGETSYGNTAAGGGEAAVIPEVVQA